MSKMLKVTPGNAALYSVRLTVDNILFAIRE